MEPMINHWETERVDTFTAKDQKLNQKVAEREDGTRRARLARSRRAGGGTLCGRPARPSASAAGESDGRARGLPERERTNAAVHEFDYCSASYIEQAAAAGKPGPGPGPAGKKNHKV